MPRQTLEQWIHEAIVDDTKEGKCTRIVLVHMVGQREEELLVINLGSRQWDPKELATTFRNKAENYADELPGVQTFNLLAFYADRGQQQNRKPFVINGRQDNGGLMTEGPTKEGIVQQSMRHTEVMLQLFLKSQASTMESNTRTIEMLSRDNASLRNENSDAYLLVREMLMKEVTERKKDAMEVLAYERKTSERKQIMDMIPMLVNTITGKEVFPQNSVDSKIIDGIAESISEEHVELLSKIIKPELLGPLMQRMGKTLERKRLATEIEINPEDDAAGGVEH